MVRNLQKLWRDTCSIYNFEKVKDPKTKTTEFKEVLVQENIPCRISFQNISATSETNSIAVTNQVIKLFLSNEIEIKEIKEILLDNDFDFKNLSKLSWERFSFQKILDFFSE